MSKILKSEFKVFLRTIYLPLLSLVAIFYIPINNIIWHSQWTSQINIDSLYIVFSFSQGYGLILFFLILVISYELFHKFTGNNMQEYAYIFDYNKTILAKVIIAASISLLVCLGITSIDIYWLIFAGGRFDSVFLQALFATFVNFFIPSLTAIILGFFMGLKFGRVVSVSFLFVYMYIVSPMSLNMIYYTFKWNSESLLKLKDFLTVTAESSAYVLDSLVGVMAESFRLIQNLFWIALIGMGIIFTIIKNPKIKAVGTISCLLVVLLSFNTAYQRTGSFQRYSDTNVRKYSYSNESYKFYSENLPVNFQEKDDIKVISYDMEMNIGLELSALVTVTLDDNYNSPIFTLHHAYDIESILDSENNNLTFTRLGDTFRVDSEDVDEFTIKYSGMDIIHYSNSQAINLIATHAYYPIAGIHDIYGDRSRYVPFETSGKIDFDVTVNTSSKVYSNIAGDNNVFVGSSDSLTLVSGLLAQGENCVYSQFFNPPAADIATINQDLKNIIAEMGLDIQVSIPDDYLFICLPSESLKYTAAEISDFTSNIVMYDDHAIVSGRTINVQSIAELYLKSYFNLSEQKLTLKTGIDTFLSDIERWPYALDDDEDEVDTSYEPFYNYCSIYYDRYKTVFDKTIFRDCFVDSAKLIGVEETAKKVYEYIYSYNEVSNKEFLEALREGN